MQRRISEMESFIQFKINNKQKSCQEGRALQLKTQYQRDLDHDYKKVDAKEKQLKHIEYEAKKIKKQVWEQLLLISRTVERLEKERYEYANQMRMMREERDRATRELETRRKEIAKQEKEIQFKLQKTQEQTQEYLEDKLIQLATLKVENQDWSEKIGEKQPAVKQYYDKRFREELLLEQIEKTKAQSQQIKLELAVLKQKEENAYRRAMQILRSRQEEENKQSDKKKQYIIQFIGDLNQILSMQASSEEEIMQNWEIIRLKQRHLNSQEADERSEASMMKQQKYKDIKDRITVQEQMSIDQKLIPKYEAQIQQLRDHIEAKKHEEEVLEKLCQSLRDEQNTREKEVKNLQETIAKITKNLSKA